MNEQRVPDDEVQRTIRVSDRDLRAAARILDIIVGLSDGAEASLLHLPSAAPISDRSAESLRGRAKEIFQERRRRLQFFSRSMLGEPAWDMLLAMYIMDNSGPLQTVGTLLALSGVPRTTALRWLESLEAQQLVLRKTNANDRRTEYVFLTDKARKLMTAYLSETGSVTIE
jgi:DNA-binding MarR family transcriptional regulator